MYVETAVQYFAKMGWKLVESTPASRHFPDYKWMLVRPVDSWWAPLGLPFKNIRSLWQWWGEQALRAMQVEALCPLVANFYTAASDEMRETILTGLGDEHPHCWSQWSNDFADLQDKAVKTRPRLGQGWLREAKLLCLAHESSFHPQMLAERLLKALSLYEQERLDNRLPRASSTFKTASRL